MDYSGQTAIRLRSLGRRLGFFPPLVRAFRRLAGSRYEERFDAALLRAIRSGDVVWDVGANVGLYTAKFAGWAGPAGQVVAFEPSPHNVDELRKALGEAANVTVYAAALGETPGHATFYANHGDRGTTDSMVPRSQAAQAHAVPVRCGDEFLAQHPPNVIKIDVEGFELEVLRGMPQVLASPGLRSVLIEVHFGILSDRGLADAPAVITGLLKQAGLTVEWVDASHLVGSRSAQS